MVEMTQEPPKTVSEMNKKIKHDMTPDPAWDPTGEMIRDTAGNRWPVYRETILLKKRSQDRDADGKPLYHFHPDGSPNRRRPVMIEEQLGAMTREFVVQPVGNGVVQKNYDFRPAPGEIERRDNAEREAKAITELSKVLTSGGKGFTDLLELVKTGLGIKAAEAVTEVVTAPPAPKAEGKKGKPANDQDPGV